MEVEHLTDGVVKKVVVAKFVGLGGSDFFHERQRHNIRDLKRFLYTFQPNYPRRAFECTNPMKSHSTLFLSPDPLFVPFFFPCLFFSPLSSPPLPLPLPSLSFLLFSFALSFRLMNSIGRYEFFDFSACNDLLSLSLFHLSSCLLVDTHCTAMFASIAPFSR